MNRTEARARFRAYPKTWGPLAPHLNAQLAQAAPTVAELEDGRRRAERLGDMFRRQTELACVGFEVIGSVARRTANGPLSDVDLLLRLNEAAWQTRGQRYAPATVLGAFRERLRQRYGALEEAGYVEVRDQTHSIGLRFASDRRIDVDVVPAFSGEERVWEIPERGTGRWVRTQPAAQLQTLNRLELPGQPVRRAVRLLKLWRQVRRGPTLPAVAVEVLVLYARMHEASRSAEGLVEATLRWMVDTGLREPVTLVPQPMKRSPICIMDTGVRENNLTRGITAAQRDAIVARARDTLEAMDRVLPRLARASDWGLAGALSRHFPGG